MNMLARLAVLGLLLAGPAGAATFPAIFDTEETPGGPMAAAEVAAGIRLPPGFRASVFAAEPDVRQPIAMTTDPRGRLWVAENYTYSESDVGYHPELRDRIVIFEDADNDGRFDRRTVFWEGERITSVEVGHGGAWVLSLPRLIFLPDRDGNDVPDTVAEVVLDGFDYERTRHNAANGLRWGPDGWLYGRHGITSPSRVGSPGAAEDQRTLVSAGIWRFHPLRRTFEVVADGTTNPWGMDWNARGEPFFINTVIGHLWHLVPGAHYTRMRGDDPNPRNYELIAQHADHVHWATGEDWRDVRQGVTNATDAAGGGHAHSGLLIYQGGQWPAEWNGRLLTANFHGRRFNVDRLERRESGYVGIHEPDAFAFPDRWFRGVELLAAPDGGVFVSDWSDAGECHDNDGISRTTGRIYKLRYGDPVPRQHGDLGKLPAFELARLQLSPNDWLARQSRRVLADRAAAGIDVHAAVTELARIEAEARNPVHRLRALWARHVAQAGDRDRLHALLADPDEHVRAWAIRLLFDVGSPAPADLSGLAADRLPRLAAGEANPFVRLTLASILQRIPTELRAPLASPLLQRAEDAADHNLPLMLWYGIQPLASAAAADFDRLISDSAIPLVQRLGARRLAEEIDSAPRRLDALLVTAARNGSDASRRAVLDGVAAALQGRRSAPPPPSWSRLREMMLAGPGDDALKLRIRDLGVVFGDREAIEQTRAAVVDQAAELDSRRRALQVLVDAGAPGMRDVYERALREAGLAGLAATGLARIDDPAIADVLIAAWRSLDPADKPAVMTALVSRPSWATRTLAALESGTLSRSDLSAAHAQRIRAFKDPALTERLASAWGAVRSGGASGQERVLREWKRRLAPEVLARADLERGRMMYRAVCAACHKLNGAGGTIGPDLTGSNRDNLDYLLENILFPNAMVPDAYRQTTLTMKDGRVLVGLVHNRSERALQLQTGTETLAVDTREIAQEEQLSLSPMPEGLLDAIGEEPARDLIAYLKNMDAATAPK